MPEVAINAPFDSNEIKDIACEEFRKVLDLLGPLQGAKEYASFEIDFNIPIRLRRAGGGGEAKDTLAWGSISRGPLSPGMTEELSAINSSFESGDPNEERMARHMPMTVETKDGHGGVVRKKVRIEK